MSGAADAIPFVDLARQHAPIADDLRGAFERLRASGAFTLGDEVEAFEREFASYVGVSRCVGVASGTAALTIALQAAGVGRGGEVIVPAHTFIASALAVVHAGAEPVFCDVEEETGLIDLDSALSVVSERTVAVMPVHLYGQVCDMGAVGRFADERGLAVVEDAAQAHGAEWEGRRAGSFGTVSAFSFYPSKNLGAFGDGGAVCTGDPRIAERAERLRNLGQRAKGEHLEPGYNERLDALQAALLGVKLSRLDEWNRARREAAAWYRQALPVEACCLPERAGAHDVFHLFPVRVAERDAVAAALRGAGIATGIHYYPAVHRQPPFESAGGELPAAERWASEELSLPMFPGLRRDEVEHVCGALAEVGAGEAVAVAEGRPR